MKNWLDVPFQLGWQVLSGCWVTKTLPKSAVKYEVFARVADILNNVDQLSYHRYSLHIKLFLFTFKDYFILIQLEVCSYLVFYK